MAGLMLGLHRRAITAERYLADAEMRLQQGGLGVLGQTPFLLPPQLARDEMPSRTGDLDGRAVTVLELPAIAGELLGLQPGDVVQVLAAETRPAAQ
jgi:hypothetical protein